MRRELIAAPLQQLLFRHGGLASERGDFGRQGEGSSGSPTTFTEELSLEGEAGEETNVQREVGEDVGM